MRGKRGGVSIIRLLRAAAVLTVVFSLLTGLEIPYPGIELFSHFRLQYFVVSVLLLAVFTFLRHYIYMGTLAIAAIFNAVFVLPWYFADPAIATGEPLKLLHANVLSSNTEYERLVDLVVAENPDMIFLQEMTPEWVAGISVLLREYPYSYAEPRHDSFGLATYSKIPFDSVRHIDSPPLGYPTIIAMITIDNKPLTIISSHPTVPLGQELRDARNEHLESTADLVRQVSGDTVLLGDFNSSIWGTQLLQLEESTGLRNAREGFGILPSWPTFLPFAMIPIDHVLVSESIGVENAKTGRGIGSDHLPLIVTLVL